jgi:hypothetical protein
VAPGIRDDRVWKQQCRPGIPVRNANRAWFGDPRETRDAAREMNEFAARMKSDHKGRYGQFASAGGGFSQP